jgi:hypothetical protein
MANDLLNPPSLQGLTLWFRPSKVQWAQAKSTLDGIKKTSVWLFLASQVTISIGCCLSFGAGLHGVSLIGPIFCALAVGAMAPISLYMVGWFFVSLILFEFASMRFLAKDWLDLDLHTPTDQEMDLWLGAPETKWALSKIVNSEAPLLNADVPKLNALIKKANELCTQVRWEKVKSKMDSGTVPKA